MRGVNILHTVENYYPSVGGAQEVVRQLSERLAQKGHTVTVATTKRADRTSTKHNGVTIAEFDVSGNAVRGYSGKDVEKYKNFLKNSRFDVVMNYAAQQWTTDLFSEVIDKWNGGKVFVPCGFSGLYNPQYKQYFKDMPALLKKYDASVYLSNDYRDINFARKHNVKNTKLIPNGAGADEFLAESSIDTRKLLDIKSDSFLVLSVGSHTGVKGHAESIEIFKAAAIPNSTLLIIANDLDGGCTKSCHQVEIKNKLSLRDRLQSRKIRVKDLPRDLTVAVYKAADVFLFPSNIEASPLVLFEAAAAKLPFLASDVGNSREIASWTKGGEILPTTFDDEGYSHIKLEPSVKLLKKMVDQSYRQPFAEHAFKAWQKHYSWEVIVDRYEELYTEVAK